MVGLPGIEVIDPEIEKAVQIIANYLGRQYGGVPLGQLECALAEIYRLKSQYNVRHPLLLANKAIAVVEREERAKAA